MHLLSGAIVSGPGGVDAEFRAGGQCFLDRAERRVGEAAGSVWRALGDHGCAPGGHRHRAGREPGARWSDGARETRYRGAARERGVSLGARVRQGDYGARAAAGITGGGDLGGTGVQSRAAAFLRPDSGGMLRSM
jgi:hypothetical protein